MCPRVLTHGYAGADVRLLWWRLPPGFSYSNEDTLKHDPLQVMGDFKLICRGMRCIEIVYAMYRNPQCSCGMNILICPHYKVFIYGIYYYFVCFGIVLQYSISSSMAFWRSWCFKIRRIAVGTIVSEYMGSG